MQIREYPDAESRDHTVDPDRDDVDTAPTPKLFADVCCDVEETDEHQTSEKPFAVKESSEHVRLPLHRGRHINSHMLRRAW